MRTTRRLGLLLFIVVMYLIVVGVNTYMHEEVHKAIYVQYGCSNVTVEYSLTGGSTTCLDGSRYDTKGNEFHIINEIVGYNTQTLMVLIFVGTVTYVVLKD